MNLNQNDAEKKRFEAMQQKCAEEKIHIPGAIQPYTYLLVLDSSLTIHKYSENIDDLLGHDGKELLSKNVADLFDEASLGQLKQLVHDDVYGDNSLLSLTLKNADNPEPYPAFLYSANDLLLLEIEKPLQKMHGTTHRPKGAFAQKILKSNSLKDQQQLLVDAIRNTTGYDLSLLYVFDDEWNGQVVAESASVDSRGFLGLNFPSTDIPKQARDLYFQKSIRYIPQVDYEPQKMLPDDLDAHHKPIDLSGINARSISPMHQEYMQNLGINASMSLAVFQNDKLYGLIICHSKEATYVGPYERATALNIAFLYSSFISVPDRQAAKDIETRKHECMSEFAHAIRSPENKHQPIEELFSNFLRFMEACGVIFSIGGNHHVFGKTPSNERTQAIIAAIEERGEQESYLSNSIENDLGLPHSGADNICGALALPAPKPQGSDFIIWFREEDTVEKNWAGEPIKRIQDDQDSFSPRQNFDVWKQVYTRHSRAWEDEKKKLAEDIAHIALAVTELVLLQGQNQVLLQAIEACQIGITLADANMDDTPFTYVNQAFLNQTGYELDEMLGRNCRFLQGEGTDPDTIRVISKAVKAFEPVDVDVLNYKKDGTPFLNNLRIAPVHNAKGEASVFVGIQTDVTAERQAMRFEQERQKLESLGRLSANVSHEIKNALQPIRLMLEALDDAEELSKEHTKKFVSIAIDNMNIAENIVKDVLRFSRDGQTGKEPIEAMKLADNLSHFVRNLAPRSVSIQTHIDDSLLKNNSSLVSIHQNGIYQIMTNLTNNAMDATNQKGNIIFSASVGPLQQASAIDLPEGEYLSLSIEDNGEGIACSVLENIFQPFFSTKSPSEGTGLGLSISSKMAQEHGGTITAQNGQDAGAKFTLHLPIVEA
jgi:PAS domain S-box-containing protein